MNNSYFFLLFMLFFSSLFMYFLYEPFLISITIASLFAMATYNIKLPFDNKPILRASILTIILFAIFFIPMIYLLSFAIPIILKINPKEMDWNIYIQTVIYYTPDFTKPYIKDVLDKIDIALLAKNGFSILGSITSKGTGFIKDVVLILVFYFFAVYCGRDIVNYIRNIIPLKKNKTNILLSEVTSTMTTVLFSIIANAILQGILFAVIAYIFSFDPLLFGTLYGFSSLIPVVGGLVVWLPMSLNLIIDGNISAAIILALYSIIVISIFADTLAKPTIIKYIASTFVKGGGGNINEMLVFFSIIAGLSTFGFWGMILGPAITTLFLAILKVYESLNKEIE